MLNSRNAALGSFSGIKKPARPKSHNTYVLNSRKAALGSSSCLKKRAKPKSLNLRCAEQPQGIAGVLILFQKKNAKPKSPYLDVLNSRKAALGS
jgi:hypothetical protein